MNFKIGAKMSNEKSNNKTKFDKEFYEKYKSKFWTAVFFTVALVLFVVNNTTSEPENGPYPPNYNEVSGELLKLSDYKGKIVIVDFWATWCPPCRKAIPDLVELKAEFKDEIEIIGISVDKISRGTHAQLPSFMTDNNINYPVVHGDPQVAQAYGGIRSIPTSFVVDKDGKIVSYHTGYVPKDTYVKDINKTKEKGYDNSEANDAPDFALPVVTVPSS